MCCKLRDRDSVSNLYITLLSRFSLSSFTPFHFIYRVGPTSRVHFQKFKFQNRSKPHSTDFLSHTIALILDGSIIDIGLFILFALVFLSLQFIKVLTFA